MSIETKNYGKPRLILTKLPKPQLTGEQYRIDNIFNVSILNSTPFKLGELLTAKQVDSIIVEKKYTISRIQAANIL